MPDMIMLKTPSGFVVIDEAGEAALRRIPNNKLALLTWQVPQNLEWRRKFFLLIDRLFACGLEHRFKSAPALRKAILIAAGYTEPQVNLQGEINLVAQSMRFDQMKQPEFAEFWDKAMDIILSEIVPTLDHDAFGPEIDKMLELVDGDRRAA